MSTEEIVIVATPEEAASALQERAAQPEPSPPSFAVNGVEMVYVPAGPFVMGTYIDDPDSEYEERPAHILDLPAFWIARYPTTNEQYQRFIQATDHNPPPMWDGDAYPEGTGAHPVLRVTWRDAQAYCQWASELEERTVRLPSEAEWEKAASWDPESATRRRYPWGNDWNRQLCNSVEAKLNGTTPVGQYSPDGDASCGAADMAGNAWEWTTSILRRYPYQADDGREDVEAEGRRVTRGGSYYSNRKFCRCGARDSLPPRVYNYNLGFRVAVSIPPEGVATLEDEDEAV